MKPTKWYCAEIRSPEDDIKEIKELTRDALSVTIETYELLDYTVERFYEKVT